MKESKIRSHGGK